MKYLYVDCFSEISKDMFLAALLDAGLPLDYLKGQLHRLNIPEHFDIQVMKVNKGAIQASLLDLDFGHAAQGEGHHAHDHEPTHHRHLGDIQALIEASDLSKRVKETTLDVFQRLAEAEARVHGTTIEEVHFHEVGALDSIIDTTGAAIGLELSLIHISEPTRLGMISYAVFCLKKKNTQITEVWDKEHSGPNKPQTHVLRAEA